MLSQYPEQVCIAIRQSHMLIIDVNLAADGRHDQAANDHATD